MAKKFRMNGNQEKREKINFGKFPADKIMKTEKE
jgi:hypothetical protein